jgi:hypothetical protein
MFGNLENLRSQSEPARKRLVLGLSLAVTVLIFLIWLAFKIYG